MINASNDFDFLDDTAVKSVFEHADGRIHAPAINGCSIDDLKRKVTTWRSEGSVVVFTAGVFDILHVSHLLALTHYRLLGAREYLVAKKGISNPSIGELQAVAASDKVRFILSVDSDARAAQDKAFIPSKGNCSKPLVSWRNRVLLLTRQHISGESGDARPLIDFVTVHGPDGCTCETCPHQDDADIAIAIQPDLVIASSSGPETIRILEANKEASKSKLVVIKENSLEYHDHLLGGPIKSSAIIKRAQSGLDLP